MMADSILSVSYTHLAGIQATEKFFESLGMAIHLTDLGIGADQIELMASKACRNGQLGSFKVLKKDDVKAIYELAL